MWMLIVGIILIAIAAVFLVGALALPANQKENAS